MEEVSATMVNIKESTQGIADTSEELRFQLKKLAQIQWK